MRKPIKKPFKNDKKITYKTEFKIYETDYFNSIIPSTSCGNN